MATIVKTESGTWKALVRKTGWPTTSKTFRTKRDAEDWARRTEDEMVRGVYIQRTPSEKMTVLEAFERYEREVMPTKADETQDKEQSRLRLLKNEFGKYSLVSVTPSIVAKFRDMRLDAGKATDTVRLDLALLGHLYSTAIKEWHIALPFNPVAMIKKPSPGKGREYRIPLQDQNRLMEELKKYSNPMLAWIFEIAIETGMRRSEIRTLRTFQVNLERRIVSLSKTKNGEQRTVPLSKKGVEIFREALSYPMRPSDCDLIFFGEPGKSKKRSPYCFDKAWREVRNRAGFNHLHFHDSRHEAVSRLVEGGFSDQEAASVSGHKSMQTLKRYTHLRAEDLVAKLDKIE